MILKKSYENIKDVLETLKYDDDGWMICVDLKMMNLVLEQQGGYTKYSCFLRSWDSKAKDEHWIKDKCSAKNSLTPEKKNVIHSSLVDSKKIILPPFHIKLRVMKQMLKPLIAMESDLGTFAKPSQVLVMKRKMLKFLMARK